jgi:anti-sigma regulatory factor (Ser/Thr protein kinase)
LQTPQSTSDPAGLPQPAALQLELACALDRVRPTAEAVRRFLKEQGCQQNDLMDCELALVEACNNALQYAAPEASQLPVKVEVLCLPQEIELRITDHTAGFAWPEKAALPESESQRGRGVYLIQTLMNETSYLRQPGGNRLILRKRRSAHKQ